MQIQTEFGFKDLFTHVIGDMAKAIAERHGESQERKFARSQAAVHMIMAFLPRDAIEAMLAGHAVMFHEMITDSVRETLRGELEKTRRGTRANIIAMNKAFHENLDKLSHFQTRHAEGQRDAEPPPRPAETPPPDIGTQAAEVPSPTVQPVAATPPTLGGPDVQTPATETTCDDAKPSSLVAAMRVLDQASVAALARIDAKIAGGDKVPPAVPERARAHHDRPLVPRDAVQPSG